jgi:hypothetical protein
MKLGFLQNTWLSNVAYLAIGVLSFIVAYTLHSSLVIVIIGAILAIANALSDGKEPNVRKLLTTVGVTLAFEGAMIANKDNLQSSKSGTAIST